VIFPLDPFTHWDYDPKTIHPHRRIPMPMATIHVSAFNNPLDADVPQSARDRIRFSVLADVNYTYARATHVSPEEHSLVVNNIRHMDVAFDVANTEGGYGEDGLQGDRAGDTYEWEITNHDDAEAFLDAWGIDLECEDDWEFDGDGPDPDDARDRMLDDAWIDHNCDMIDDAYERHVQAELRGDA